MVDFTKAADAQFNTSNPDIKNPFGSSVLTVPTDGSRPTLNQTLSPAEQAILNQNQQLRTGIATGTNAALPAWMQQIQAPLGYGAITNNLDFSGAPGMPQVDKDVLNKSIAARYGEGAQYLDPQFQQGQQALDSTLANQGIVRNPGDPNSAWGKEQTNFGNTKQKAYSDLMQNSITGGMDDMTKYFGMGLQARQQGVNEATTQGVFANQAQNQGFNQGVTKATTTADLLKNMTALGLPNVPTFPGMTPSQYVTAAQGQGQVEAANKNVKTALEAAGLGGLTDIIAKNPGIITSLPASIQSIINKAMGNSGTTPDLSTLPPVTTPPIESPPPPLAPNPFEEPPPLQVGQEPTGDN